MPSPSRYVLPLFLPRLHLLHPLSVVAAIARRQEDTKANALRLYVPIQQDLTLPKSIITRLAKGVLPPNTQIQTNAVLAMSKSATVFINHLASAANEHTKNANKKTIMPADVFSALEDIEFPFLREALEAEFKSMLCYALPLLDIAFAIDTSTSTSTSIQTWRYAAISVCRYLFVAQLTDMRLAEFNEVQTTKRNTYRRKVAAAKAGKSAPDADAAAAGTKSTGAATSASKNASDPNASTATAEPTNATPRSKKQKPNGPDDSQMDVDGGANEGEERDPSDADTESEQEQHEDEEEDEGHEDEEEDDEEGDEDENDHTMQETIEEKDGDDEDEALDNGADSD